MDFKTEDFRDSMSGYFELDLLQEDPLLNESLALQNINYEELPPQQVQFAPQPPPFHPVSPIGPPDRYPMSEPSKFSMQIHSGQTRTKKFVYSHVLNRIYVVDNTPIALELNWDHTRFPGPMYVRATTVFSDEAQAQKRVVTCVQHSQAPDMIGKPKEVAYNVLRSARTDVTMDGVYYCGDPDREDSWMSVVVRFNKRTSEPVGHAYLVVCKNSCSSGINRRAIAIVFTLEDASGVVHGRVTVGMRSCACPYRDMHREERELDQDNGTEGTAQNPTKKRRLQPHATSGNVLIMPALPVLNPEIMKTGLAVILSMTEQAAAMRKDDPQTSENAKKCIEETKKYLEDLKKPPPSPPHS